MERVFGVRNPNISAWRRATCSDLTAAFDFSRTHAFPDLPTIDELPTPGNPANASTEAGECLSNPAPVPPAPTAQTVPTQEPGTRPRRGRGEAMRRSALFSPR